MENTDLLNEIKLHLIKKKKITVEYLEVTEEIKDMTDGTRTQNEINEMSLMLYNDLEGKFKIFDIYQAIIDIFGYEATEYIYIKTMQMFGPFYDILDKLK